ncbi:toxin-antitoxin system HicB family antitoxin [Actinocrispum wychmicini]|uniref:HicB-like protein involved in pilus formation n=1 Tax=Actinocrispum wychmicini TaxID=1213861 RepID=A0A4V6NNX1_9PSEU|nr:toxin-antitoxin system HicB family antitoxin [Actinocrispum wychmicini]TCO58620.1 HicB-like protein involved in pilus formation [Actinocrispum wychmicini]
MAQVSWRADDDLVERVRRAATSQGKSLNEFITRVLEAAVNPELASDELTRIRERLARVDLVVLPTETRVRPPREAFERAREAAGKGTPLSDLVSKDRERG